MTETDVLRYAAFVAFGWYLGKGVYTVIVDSCIGVCRWLARCC